MDDFLGVPPSIWVGENAFAFAIEDRFPVSPGHTLVIPRRKVATWFEASREEQLALLDLVDETKRRLDRERQPAGYNVGFNAGAAAGQTVMHLHVHVIPRYEGDMHDPRGGVRHVIPGKGNYLGRASGVTSERPAAPVCPCTEMVTQGFEGWMTLAARSQDPSDVPARPGVYMLRATSLGTTDVAALCNAYLTHWKRLYEHKREYYDGLGLGWSYESGYIERRLGRLGQLDAARCRLLYIGMSSNVRERLKQLLWFEEKHTAEAPVRALLLGGWDLEHGYYLNDEPREEEDRRKALYRQHHGGLPPLVGR